MSSYAVARLAPSKGVEPASTMLGGGVALNRDLPNIVKYWRVALRWKFVIAGVIGTALIAGLIITLLMTPLYTATASIEISRQQDKIVDVADVRPESSAVDIEFYQTQYSLLQARSLAERVAVDLQLADNDGFFEMFNVALSTDSLFADQANRRRTPAQREERQRKAVETLLKNIGISPIRGSRLVDVSFTSPDAEFSARVTNAWTSHFIDSNLERRFESTSYARKFLESRLGQLRERLQESERQLVAYATQQKIINLTTSETGDSRDRQERPLVADDLSALNTALSQAIADRIGAQSRLAGAGRGTGTGAEALANSGIANLRQKRAEVAAEYARLLVQFEPEYPVAKALASQVAQLDRSIAREESRVRDSIGTTYKEAVAREGALQQRVEGLKSDLLDLRRRSIQYNIFQRDVDTNRQLYDGLLQRYKEIGVAGGVGTNNVAIVDPAKAPEKPSRPRLGLNLALALLVGVALAGIANVALEQIDEAVKDPSEIGKSTGLPLLGTIPQTKDVPLLELLQDRKSSTAEAYMSVQTNLQFTTDHGVPRSLAVTSTQPAEGKSTTSYAIVQSLARTQRKVILVDCDMRSPSVHHLLGVSNDRGVSNFLAGDDDLAATIVRVADLSISALTAGPQPPNAAELLTGPRLSQLIAKLLETFDHVVIDSPPVLGLADAPLIASRVEGVIYAVEAYGARSSAIRTALARLQNANANLLGVILTKFEAKRAHYGYGYDYGYGYGDQKDASS